FFGAGVPLLRSEQPYWNERSTNMLRKVLIGSLAVLGTVGALALPASAEAGTDIRINIGTAPAPVAVYYPPTAQVVPVVEVHRHYDVVYKRCHEGPWIEYHCYRCYDEARCAAVRLRDCGYHHVRIVVH